MKKKADPHLEREAQKYENPIPSREFILEHLIDAGKPLTREELEEAFELSSPDDLEALRRRLIAMARDGQLHQNRKQMYGPIEKMELVTGRVVGHKDGFGFLVPEETGDDLFLSPRQMRNVFHGDKVTARVTNLDSRGRREGMVVEVLERNTQQLVGRFFTESGVSYVEPASQRITQSILIPPDATKNAEQGQIVLVALTTQPTKHRRPLGEVVEVIGDHMAPGMEIKVAIRNHDLPTDWPEDVQSEAESFSSEVDEASVAGRLDLRHLPFVTIDGEDAKDFDDAVYCEVRPKGGFLLYVAIADVSHYVKEHSPLDKEAYLRGNSVYFPGRVIPMLPEALSNHLCSLKPKVDRLVMVCEMNIHAEGRITKFAFHEAVIHSHARLTYNQVHAMIEIRDKKMQKQFEEQVPHLENLYTLFEVLHKARQTRGAIDFDLPETKIEFGKDRKIERIVAYERFNSHRVIEECMLSANICAAKFLEKQKQPGLYRVHEGPKESKLQDLKIFLAEIGLAMPTHRDVVPGDYAHILRVIKDRPDGHMIQTILLRSMSQAIYGPDNRGHFGLAYEAYAHFTSPIRRYPDLLVHRAIKCGLNKTVKKLDEKMLAKAGEHCSMTERRADDATNEVKDWLKCEYMMDKVGQEFEGRISGVMSFGLFVELKSIYVEGLVHVSQLPGDYYKFDAVQHTMYGERTGRSFRLGDPIQVQVARVDLDKREIDFVLAGEEVSDKRPPKRKEKSKKKKHTRDRKRSKAKR